jgi:hypothetical protein
MGIDRFLIETTTLTMEDVRDRVEELLPAHTRERSNGYSFYPNGKGRGSLFAAVTPGPRVYVDPSAKKSVYGSTPEVIIGSSDFDKTVSWSGSFNYSRMVDQEDEIPEDVEEALVESYKLVTPLK